MKKKRKEAIDHTIALVEEKGRLSLFIWLMSNEQGLLITVKLEGLGIKQIANTKKIYFTSSRSLIQGMNVIPNYYGTRDHHEQDKWAVL